MTSMTTSPVVQEPIIPTIEEPGAPPEAERRSWYASRRLLLLGVLSAGLFLFLLWLPAGTRTAIFVSLNANRALIGLLFAFALLSLSLVWSAGQTLDMKGFMFFNLGAYRPGWLDRAMWLVTQLGTIVAGLVAAVAFWWLSLRILAIEIMLGTITLWLVVETVKALLDRGRPFTKHEGARIIGTKARGRSFPSGHTTQAFFMMTILAHRFQFNIGVTAILCILAMSVGITRMYVGAHYPRDVAAGALLGVIWAVLMMQMEPFWLGFRF